MAIFRRIANLIRRDKLQREIDAELASHLAMRGDDNRAVGMSSREAQRDARIRFGNVSSMREKTAEADMSLWIEDVAHDLRYAFRQLRRAPGFAITSILVLSLGIGACTAIFSAIKPILIDPLPLPHADRLVMVWERSNDGRPVHVTFGSFTGLAERSPAFTSIAVMKPWQPAIAAGAQQSDKPERLEGQRVSADFFRTLSITPVQGRDFQSSDDRWRGPNVVIISDRLWHRRFAADPNIVGSQIRLDDQPFTVIGILPASFEDVLAPQAELWAPLQYNQALPPNGREWGHHLRMVARLRDGVAPAQAQSASDAILHLFAQSHANGYDSTGGAPAGIIATPLQHDLTQGIRPALFAVIGSVVLVLLISCVNVANLLLARGAQRQAEFAMRAALGAANTRLVRQLLTESLVLAIAAGLIGLAIAEAGVRILIAMSPAELPRLSAISVNLPVFFFALGIAAIIGIFVGLAPALQSTRGELNARMQQSSGRTAARRHWTRSALVVAEVSLAIVLLVSAGLLLRTMQHLFSTDPGFDASHLITMQVQESPRRFDDRQAALRFFSQALDRVRQMPGVISAGFTTQLPLSGDSDIYGVEFEKDHGRNSGAAFRYSVTPGYLESMRIPLLRGRLLDEHDTFGAPTAVIINDALARSTFPGQNPIGQRLRVGPDAGEQGRPWGTIVGVVGNVKQQSLAMADDDAFYITTEQWSWLDNVQTLVVRTSGPAAALAAPIRDAIWSVDRNEPIVRITTMQSLVATSEAQRRFVLTLFAAFAVTGLILAATGLFGLLAGYVTERTREIGIRTAVGASRASIVLLILRHGLGLATVGAVIGIAGAALSSRALAALLSGISPLDPVTYLGVTLLLLCVATIACFLPARRAASIDPVKALRAD
ncbi:ADOP family duplicated permease [Acidicapsa dinghuensis]|uniref:ADOP family duplicated permease n=1 Tax=Acidicapsa dinghuensis TaxID=2218256 RepID=A0ABW1ELU5_9BACT|nr:ABC transporter permease [Acidicapsa dinghuensis]